MELFETVSEIHYMVLSVIENMRAGDDIPKILHVLQSICYSDNIQMDKVRSLSSILDTCMRERKFG